MPKNIYRKSYKQKKNASSKNNLSTTGARYPLERFNRGLNQIDYVRRIEYESIVLASTLDRYFANYFVLSSSDTANLNAYSTIFDQYKVTEVCVEWVPESVFPTTLGSTLSPGLISRISSVLDFDDAVPPSSESLLKTYPTYKTGTTNKPMGRRFATTERMITSNDGSTTSTSLVVVPTGSIGGGFIDLANTQTQFLGTKWFIAGISNVTTPNPILGRFVYSALVTFRQGR